VYAELEPDAVKTTQMLQHGILQGKDIGGVVSLMV